MVDIHTHILPNADTGCKDYNEAGKIINEAKKQGITHIVLTPHESCVAGYRNKDLIDKFNSFKKIFQKREIELFLGAEIDYSEDIFDRIKNKELLTMNNTEFILIDFPYKTTFKEVKDVIIELRKYNLKLIIAHTEIFDFSLEEIESLKVYGGYIQIDTEAILNKKYEKWLKKLYKERYIDFVSSNVHGPNNKYQMKEAFMEVASKSTKDYADLIFSRNAKNLLKLK